MKAPVASKPTRIAILATDNREHLRCYNRTWPQFGPAVESILEGLKDLDGFEIHVVSCTQRPMFAPSKLAPNMRYHLLHVPKIGWLRTGYQGCIRAIRNKLRVVRPDLVHGQGTERECAMSAVLSGYPSLVTIHGNMGELAKKLPARIRNFAWYAAQLERFTLPRANRILCNSKYTEKIVRRRNPYTCLVPNAVRLRFLEKPLPRPGHSPPILLNVGVIAPFKSQLELLRLARHLYEEGQRFRLHFIGAVNPLTTYGAAFLAEVAAAEGIGFVRYLGEKSLEDLIAAFDQAQALLHFPFEEAFGLVVAEALARNLKVFAARLGGLPELAEGVELAELIPFGQWSVLGSAIRQWLAAGCPQPRSAAAIMHKRYHPSVIAAKHAEAYREVMRG